MVEVTLLVSSTVASVASGIFLSVALRLKERPVSHDAQAAITLFAMWWLSLAVYAVVGASMDLVAAFGMSPFAVFTALAYMRLVAICIGLWGLMYYLAYVLTGSRKLMLPLAIFYSIYYAVILFVVTLQRPVDVVVQPWRTALAFDATLVAPLAIGLLLVVPPVVAAGVYLALYFRVDTRTHRWRVGLLAAATLVWCASVVTREAALLAALPPILAFVSAWAVDWAFDPPRFVKKRLIAADVDPMESAT